MSMMVISKHVEMGFERRSSTKGHIDQRLEVIFITHARSTTWSIVWNLRLRELDGTFRARGVYVISTIMSNICAILLAQSRPYCSRDNGYAFFLPFTHPPSSRVATGNPVVFTLQPPECYMEIRYGYGTTGTRVAGPVRVGDPLTLIIYMRSKYGEPHTHNLSSFTT